MKYEFPAEEGEIIKVGSLASSRLPADGGSRMHGVIEYTEGRWFVVDLGSATGTLVNGRKVNKVRLRDGDVLQVGKSTYQCTITGAGISFQLLAQEEEEPEPEKNVGPRDVQSVLTGARAVRVAWAHFASSVTTSLAMMGTPLPVSLVIMGRAYLASQKVLKESGLFRDEDVEQMLFGGNEKEKKILRSAMAVAESVDEAIDVIESDVDKKDISSLLEKLSMGR